ncbi:MAG: hypothetical protein SF066_03670 [Thermoanaerobaculia bacterium]|nr:hypothetical protein [Thermoanaerobaculia bacterium]
MIPAKKTIIWGSAVVALIFLVFLIFGNSGASGRFVLAEEQEVGFVDDLDATLLLLWDGAPVTQERLNSCLVFKRWVSDSVGSWVAVTKVLDLSRLSSDQDPNPLICGWQGTCSESDLDEFARADSGFCQNMAVPFGARTSSDGRRVAWFAGREVGVDPLFDEPGKPAHIQRSLPHDISEVFIFGKHLEILGSCFGECLDRFGAGGATAVQVRTNLDLASGDVNGPVRLVDKVKEVAVGGEFIAWLTEDPESGRREVQRLTMGTNRWIPFRVETEANLVAVAHTGCVASGTEASLSIKCPSPEGSGPVKAKPVTGGGNVRQLEFMDSESLLLRDDKGQLRIARIGEGLGDLKLSSSSSLDRFALRDRRLLGVARGKIVLGKIQEVIRTPWETATWSLGVLSSLVTLLSAAVQLAESRASGKES